MVIIHNKMNVINNLLVWEVGLSLLQSPADSAVNDTSASVCEDQLE